MHKSDLIPSTATKTVPKDDKNSSTVEPHRTSESLHYEIKTNVQPVLPKHTSDAGLAEIVSPD